MKSTMRLLSMAALALAGAIMTACAGSDDTVADTPKQPENTGKVITLKTTVGLGGGAGTRALTAGGVKTFAAGEKMALVYANQSDRRTVKESEPLTVGDIAADGKSATFTFRLTEEPNKSSSVKYIYPAAMAKADGNENDEALFTEQDGTLTKLASNFDVATANDLDWVNGNLPGATLENQLAILAITLKDDATGADITGSITDLTITARDALHLHSITYNITRSAAAGPIYVAIFSTDKSEFEVTATGGTNIYVKTLTDKTYDASNGYSVSWRMTPMNTVPLTVEALTAGTIVVSNPRSGMQYSLNGGEKTTMTETTTINVTAGDKVQFYGNGTSISSYYASSVDYTEFAGGNAEVKVYGNIMSLVDETGYASNTTLTADYAFNMLFHHNIKLKDASGLLLPATKLSRGCYYSMFYGCTSLTAAPALPAKTLAPICYKLMFKECTSLTTAPALPAKTMKSHCYNSMFYGCTSLTTAPVLPATTLATNCYESMFQGCTSLTTAPVLPAETLATNCYEFMFQGCTSLSAVTCLATKISADYCTYRWLDGVAASGTFTKAASMTNWTPGSSGIPYGWTRVDYVAPTE